MKRFVFTCGDVNGIGPEIVIKTLNSITRPNSNDIFYFICPSNIFELAAKIVQPKFKFELVKKMAIRNSSSVVIINSGKVSQKIGHPTISSGKAAYKALTMSFDLVNSNNTDAVITAPISKKAMKLAGINFYGQTEMFANWTGTKDYAMIFLSDRIFMCPFTIHSPIKDVHKLLNINKLESSIEIILRTLRVDLGINKPKIAVLGLNPHAGESGIIGTEEKEIISPVINKSYKKSVIEGPFAPDAFFATKFYKKYDLILGMYHDQVLIPFKMLNFRKGVNYTAGLPIVRTSPDHGVAFDIAGKNVADESSMVQAYKFARQIVSNRKKSIGKR